MVLARLERVSADSALAHRASGVRGALLKIARTGRASPIDQAALDTILRSAFKILEQEAGQILRSIRERRKCRHLCPVPGSEPTYRGRPTAAASTYVASDAWQIAAAPGSMGLAERSSDLQAD